jgi:hypothetical protein
MKVLAVLCTMLVIGGLLEYIVIFTVHSVYSQWDWTVAAEVPHSNYRPRLGSSLGRRQLGKRLEQVGREGILAAQEKLGGLVQGGEWEESPKVGSSSFYERREVLLKRMEGILEGYESRDNFNLTWDREKPDENWYALNSRAAHFNNGGLFDDYDSDLAKLESIYGPEVLLENDTSRPRRKLSQFEAAGNNIMLTLRTVKEFHDKRLPLLFSTWLSKVNGSNVFLMTNGRDPVWQKRAWKQGMCNVGIQCGRMRVGGSSVIWCGKIDSSQSLRPLLPQGVEIKVASMDLGLTLNP